MRAEASVRALAHGEDDTEARFAAHHAVVAGHCLFHDVSYDEEWSMSKAFARTLSLFAAASMIASVGCTADHDQINRLTRDESRFIDLTHPFGPDTIVWPTEKDFRLVVQYEGEMPGGYYYASNRIEMPEHGGTHIDAPIHFSRGKQTLDEIPVERLLGAAIRIDVSGQCAKDRDHRIS
jgi:hypothetical protein